MSLLLLSGIVLVALGGWVAAVLGGRLGPEAEETIRILLAILWIALIAQLVGALGAALLGVRGEFALPGFAYVLGALGAFACLLLAPTALGVLALPVATAFGSVLMAALMLARMVRLGYVPHASTLWKGLGELGTVGLLLVASFSPVAWQLNYLISLGFASRLGTGSVTLYTYSFAAAGIVTGITASPRSLVLAGQLAQTWDHRPESLDAYIRPMLRAGLLITLPAIALVAWIGADGIELLLGRTLSRSDAQTIALTFLLLGGMVIATTALQVPMLAAFALSWYGRIAILLATTSVVHFGITELAYTSGEIALLGLVASISTVVALVLIVVAVSRQHAVSLLVLMAREVVLLAVVCATAFVPLRLVAAALGDGLWDVPLAVAGFGLFVLLVRKWLPRAI